MSDEFFPEEGDLVVCTVKSVRNFGAFVELEEYPDKEGFIHVAEIATGWVKRMSDYVREGQRIVCKVMKIEKAKGHIDLSLKKVNAHQKREKIQDWKNEQKAVKLIEILPWKNFAKSTAKKLSRYLGAIILHLKKPQPMASFQRSSRATGPKSL